MASTLATRTLVLEIEAILKANPDIDKVSVGALIPLAQETETTAVYISVENIAMEPIRPTTTKDGYERHMLVNLYCNIDVGEDLLSIFDFTDSIETSILKDSSIWNAIVDRDVVSIDYDNQEHSPKRSVTILLDLTYRLVCE